MLVKYSRTASIVTWLKIADVSKTISVPNISVIQMDDNPRRFYILSSRYSFRS
jgi:hypothetical protein